MGRLVVKLLESSIGDWRRLRLTMGKELERLRAWDIEGGTIGKRLEERNRRERGIDEREEWNRQERGIDKREK